MTHVQRILNATPATDLADHLRRGGGNGLDVARHTTPMSLISLVEQSGLRGRGGAGFPTGKKWRTVIAAASGSPIPVIVNAAEGEPGTFKDRSLLRSNPYLVLEGACIAAHATGAHEVIVAIKASFIQEIKRLQFAIDEIAGAGWTPANGVRIVEGPGEYLFGEETALLEVIDGRPPFPRVTPPYRRGIHDNESDPGLSWDDGPAALVDNVETIANIPGIVRHGVDWYRSVGTASSPGTILCTVTGDTLRHGVGEFTMGTPLREVIDSIGGGVRTDRTIAAVLSGVSNPALGPGQLDTPVTYEHMAAVGSGLGSASFIVIDDQTSLAAVAAGTARFLAVESCGQCEPCKRDGLAIADSLRTKDAGLAEVWNRLGTVARGARCALAGQTERIVGRLLELAGTESTRDHNTPYPIVPLVDIVDGQARPDLTYASKRPDWTFAGESRDSGLWPVQRGADRQSKPRPAYHPVAQPARTGHVTPGALTTHDPFAALHRLHRDLEISVANVRRVPAAERAAALASLRAELDRHRQGTEGLIYPLVARLAPDIGDDIAWYPAHHEAHAARILDRLDIGDPISPRLVDELCADIHVSILELDYRVLPVLQSALDEDLLEELRIAADIDELMGTP